MSDQAQKPDAFVAQYNDPKFAALPYEDQQDARQNLFSKIMQGSPNWQKADDETVVQSLLQARKMFPPAFTDPKYEQLRQELERPGGGPSTRRFVYSAATQMGMTGLLTRGVVNTAKAINDTLAGAGESLNKFFGGYTSMPKGNNLLDEGALIKRAIGGDKDGVKLAKYLQQKFEKTLPTSIKVGPLSVGVPLIGGQTPTQLLGSIMGYGTDYLTTAGVAPAVEGAAPLVKMGVEAAVSGTKGLGRGLVAETANLATPSKAPVEGATDTAHGIVATVKSVATLWGTWAAQEVAFNMLGKVAVIPIKRLGEAFLKATFGRGTAALPKAEAFEKTASGELTPRAQVLQQQFQAGVAAPVARAQLGAITKDWEQGYTDALAYSRENPNAIMENPEAAIRVDAQLLTSDRNTPIGISVVPDGANTFRARQALSKGGNILGEHLTINELTSKLFHEWEGEISLAGENLDKARAEFEKLPTDANREKVKSFDLREQALESNPHYREIRDSLAELKKNMNRFSPENAGKPISDGAMLTYGEVGELQRINMKVAKVQMDLPSEGMADISKRGTLINSDKPSRFSTVSGGDYNGAIVYSEPAPESVYQIMLTKADAARAAGAVSSREDLAQWYLRDSGFDAIEHQGGDVTALYPREQFKVVSDAVNKSSREFTAPAERTPSGLIPSEQLDEMLAKAREAHGDISLPKTKKSWAESVTVQDGRPTLWYNDATGKTHNVFAERPTTYKAPSMLTGETDRFDWLTEAASRESGTQIGKLPNGDYRLQMKGQAPVQGDLARITDEFLLRSTSPAHLRVSLEAEGMSLSTKGKQLTIKDIDGKIIGTGDSVVTAMTNAGYRPRQLDGRFGPKDIEVLPEGSKFEYSTQGIRGSLSDAYKYAGHFMDVAEEEGKTSISSTSTGKLSQGHDGAYSVEIPSWGIREKFGSLEEAKDYLGGKYKEYNNIQRLANERGFTFTYQTGKGYTLVGATGTFTLKSIDDVGKILAKTPDPAWAPGGKYDAGVTIKDSADAVKRPVDATPNYRNTGKNFFDKSRLGQAITSARMGSSEHFGQNRATFAEFEKQYGLKGLSKAFTDLQAGEGMWNQQHFVDARMAESLMKKYSSFDGTDWVAVDKIKSAVSPEVRNDVLNHFGYDIKSPKRFQVLDAAKELSGMEATIHNRTGQNPAIMLSDYAMKSVEFKSRNLQRYQDMELSGPEGMRQFTEATHGNRVPDDMLFPALHERIDEINDVVKDENAITKFIRYSELANRWAYMAEPMKAFAERLFQPDVARVKDPRIVNLGKHYMTEALRMGTSDALDILRLEGKVSGQTAKAPIASLLKTLAGQGIYGFKPGTGIHVLGGNYVNGSALMTTEAMNHGLEMTNKGGVAGLQDQFTQNVFSGRAPIFQGFGDSTMGSGWVATAIAKTAKAGSFFIQNDHIMGKSFVHNGGSWLFDQHVKPWFDGGKVGSFDRIFQKIKGFRLDPGTADVVEQHLANGDYGAARHAYAMNMTDQATAQWRPEDQGIALSKGDLAKTFGQIMVNPMATASVLDRLATSGSIGDRIGALATYGKNAGMLYGASRAMGLSGSNFLPWRVINLRGGPLWQDMVTLSQAPDSKRFDYALKVLEGLPPVSWVVQSIAAVKQYQAGRPWQAFLTMVSNSSTPNMRTQAQKTLESNPPVSWLKQGAKDVGRTFSFLNPPKH